MSTCIVGWSDMLDVCDGLLYIMSIYEWSLQRLPVLVTNGKHFMLETKMEGN